MCLLASGFNLFGQLKSSKNENIYQFEDIDVGKYFNKNPHILISCGWSYTIYASGNIILLKGFLSGLPNQLRLFSIAEGNIKYLSACDRFCLILLDSGKVYKLKPKLDSELVELQYISHPINLPQKRNALGKINVKSQPQEIRYIACGNNIVVAISKSNTIFNESTDIYQLPQHMHTKQLQCGIEHAILLNVNGDIFTWGNGLRGQLGHNSVDAEEVPTLLNALSGIKIIYIAAGGWHSIALSVFGDIYSWGCNIKGQLGIHLYEKVNFHIKSPDIYVLPQIIDIVCVCSREITNKNPQSDNCQPIKLAAGSQHSLVFMSCGNVYSTGMNGYGQMGILNGTNNYYDEYQNVPILNLPKEYDIQAGNWCSFIKCYNSEKEYVY